MKSSKYKAGLLVLPFLLMSAHTVLAQSTNETQPTATQVTASFSDVKEGNPNFVAIEYLRQKNLINGYSDGTFKPYVDINRAEALKILAKAIEKTQNTDPKDFYFPDVTPIDWFFPYVVNAWNQEVVEGYPDKKFHPENVINRVEALKIVELYKGYSIPKEVTAKPYSDVAIDAWFAPYAQVAKEKTIMLEGRPDGALYPDATLTRGQFAELIYRVIMIDNPNILFARATWYGRDDVNWGTASGAAFDVNAMTAAHKTMPFGTKINVTNLANGKSVVVEINDRGPYSTGIDIDLTRSAFANIADIGSGIITTRYEIIPDIPAPSTVTTPTITPIEYGF